MVSEWRGRTHIASLVLVSSHPAKRDAAIAVPAYTDGVAAMKHEWSVYRINLVRAAATTL